jgi:urea transport system permease protein
MEKIETGTAVAARGVARRFQPSAVFCARRIFLCFAFVLLVSPSLSAAARPHPDYSGPGAVAPPGDNRPEAAASANIVRAIVPALTTGSILVIVALGLALTFALTGMINLAQGELMATGAYTTFLVQGIFADGIALTPFGHALRVPGLHSAGWIHDYWFLAALPVSFLVAAGTGLLLERGVLRIFHARPLEGTLASWGLAQLLRQLLRAVFGPDSMPVDHPEFLAGGWMVGGGPVAADQVLIFVTAVVVSAGIWVLLKHTAFGLLLRSVAQDPVMASCIGVRPQKINMLTFALGSGLAGLAGALLTLRASASPTLGQGYAANSGLVVIFSGVGNLLGAVLGGFGFAGLQQFLEPAVLSSPGDSLAGGNLFILGALLIFFQRRPAGLFGINPRDDRTW